MAVPSVRRVFRKMRTASSLPGRVVDVEDQGRALEQRVGDRLDEVRYELAEIRRLLEAMNQADAEAVELTGRLLRSAEERLETLEEYAGIAIESTPQGVPSA